ncbi:MAG: thiamine phosphate synthase [Flavobacteriales bacterium]|nr:thiamine phosphate synthase [Flavobacteriales bacterium]
MKVAQVHYISQGQSAEEHLTNIESACIAGANLVQLRLKNIRDKVLTETALKARKITTSYQTCLIINDYYKLAKLVKADGVHLGKNDTCPTLAREYLGANYLIGGTANTLEDCEDLIQKKLDYIGLGPFRFTTTKDNLSPVLGLEGYSKLLKSLGAKIPIIGIGGITINDVENLMTTGLYGLAFSGEITRDFNKIDQINRMIEASQKKTAHSKIGIKNTEV